MYVYWALHELVLL